MSDGDEDRQAGSHKRLYYGHDELSTFQGYHTHAHEENNDVTASHPDDHNTRTGAWTVSPTVAASESRSSSRHFQRTVSRHDSDLDADQQATSQDREDDFSNPTNMRNHSYSHVAGLDGYNDVHSPDTSQWPGSDAMEQALLARNRRRMSEDDQEPHDLQQLPDGHSRLVRSTSISKPRPDLPVTSDPEPIEPVSSQGRFASGDDHDNVIENGDEENANSEERPVYPGHDFDNGINRDDNDDRDNKNKDRASTKDDNFADEDINAGAINGAVKDDFDEKNKVQRTDNELDGDTDQQNGGKHWLFRHSQSDNDINNDYNTLSDMDNNNHIDNEQNGDDSSSGPGGKNTYNDPTWNNTGRKTRSDTPEEPGGVSMADNNNQPHGGIEATPYEYADESEHTAVSDGQSSNGAVPDENRVGFERNSAGLDRHSDLPIWADQPEYSTMTPSAAYPGDRRGNSSRPSKSPSSPRTADSASFSHHPRPHTTTTTTPNSVSLLRAHKLKKKRRNASSRVSGASHAPSLYLSDIVDENLLISATKLDATLIRLFSHTRESKGDKKLDEEDKLLPFLNYSQSDLISLEPVMWQVYPMGSSHKEAIDQEMDFIVDNISPKDIIRSLYQDEVLTHMDYNQLMRTEGQGERAVNRLLLRTLQRRGDKAYPKLMNALKTHDYTHVHDRLADAEKVISEGMTEDKAEMDRRTKLESLRNTANEFLATSRLASHASPYTSGPSNMEGQGHEVTPDPQRLDPKRLEKHLGDLNAELRALHEDVTALRSARSHSVDGGEPTPRHVLTPHRPATAVEPGQLRRDGQAQKSSSCSIL